MAHATTAVLDNLVVKYGAATTIGNEETTVHALGRTRQLELKYDQATAGTKFLPAVAVNPPDGARAFIPAGAVIRTANMTVEQDFVPDAGGDTLSVSLKAADGSYTTLVGLIAAQTQTALDAGVTIEGAGAYVNGPALDANSYITVVTSATGMVNSSEASGAYTSAVSNGVGQVYSLALAGPGSNDVTILSTSQTVGAVTVAAADLDTATTAVAATLAATGYTTSGTFAAGTRVFTRIDGEAFEITNVTDFGADPGGFAEPLFVGVIDNGDPAFASAAVGKFRLLVRYDEPLVSQAPPGFTSGVI